MKAYCSESPVFWSLITSQLTMDPNLEKMISKSSAVVTGFSLQTNKTFSGGLPSASGISPTISKICAFDLLSLLSTISFTSSSVFPSNGLTSSSYPIRSLSVTVGGSGDLSGITSPLGSSKGSSRIIVCRILMSLYGLPCLSQ